MFTQKRDCKVVLGSFNIRSPVLLNLLNSLRKSIKCSASLAFDLFSPTSLINSMKFEYSCKILYVPSHERLALIECAPKSPLDAHAEVSGGAICRSPHHTSCEGFGGYVHLRWLNRGFVARQFDEYQLFRCWQHFRFIFVLLSCRFLPALWSPRGKGLISWLPCVFLCL